MRFKPVPHLCLLLMLWPNFQLSAQSSARLELDSNQVETGNPLVLHLTVPMLSRPDTLNFRAWQEYVSPKNIVEQSSWTRQDNSFTCDLTLIFFDADTFNLAPLKITNSAGDTSVTNALEIKVYPTPSPDDLNDMSPIKDINREPVLWTDYLPIIAMVLGALGILALLFWWYSRPKKVTSRSRVIELPAHVLAVKKLDALKQRNLWKQGAIKEHCAELTFIMREYLEKRFKVLALESASSELIGQLSNSTDFPAELTSELAQILTIADLAKFAKAIPPEAFHEQSLDFAYHLVASTLPKEPEPQENAPQT